MSRLESRIGRTMKAKRSIRSLIFLNMVLVTLVSLGLWSIFWIYNGYREFKTDAEVLRQEYVNGQKELIKQEVDTVLSYINNMRTQTEIRLKESIRSRVHQAIQIAANIYEQNKGIRPAGDIKKMIKDALRPIRFNKGRGYYFAFNLKGVEEAFPWPAQPGRGRYAFPSGWPG